jgi:hypothetical protein
VGSDCYEAKRCYTLAQNETLLEWQTTLGGVTQPGRFYHDITKDTLYAWCYGGGDPDNYDMEASCKEVVDLYEGGSYTTFWGLDLRYGKQGVFFFGGLDKPDSVFIDHCYMSGVSHTSGENPALVFCAAATSDTTAFGYFNRVRSCSLGNAYNDAFDHGNGICVYSESYFVVESCFIFAPIKIGIQFKHGYDIGLLRNNVARFNTIVGASVYGVDIWENPYNDSLYGNTLIGGNTIESRAFYVRGSDPPVGGYINIFNNTMYNWGYTGLEAGGAGGGAPGSKFKYNIQYDDNTEVEPLSRIGPTETTHWTIDSNLIYADVYQWMIDWDWKTLSAWRNNYGYDVHSDTGYALIGFRDPENGDFSRPGSSQEMNLTYGGKTWTRYGAWQPSASLDTTPPANITNLATSSPTSNSIRLTWTAPGDDGNVGTASRYDIRYSTSTITQANWPSATPVSGEPTPQVAGTSQSMTVTGLNSSTTYYFAMKTADEVPNWSGLSNVASGTTQQPTNQPPQITSIQCQKNGSWVACSQIQYGDIITRVRANVTDSDGTVASVRFRLENLPDNHEFFNGLGSSAGGGWYVLNNNDLLIQDGGDFRLTVTATDDDAAQASAESTWLVPWGTLSASLINPAQNCSVYQNQAFSFQARLTCQGGECGDIQATIDPLLSLNRSAYASSVEESGFEPEYAVDGNMSTRWSSSYTDNEWFYVDLEDICSVEQVVIRWEDAYGQEYKIQVSEDALSWTEVVHITNGDGGSDDLSFEPVRARYVRMLGIHRGTAWGYSIWEFEVYGEEITSNTKGAISTTLGATPFYTTSGNPQTQANMKAGDVFNQAWQVVPTGVIGENYEFFVINHPTTYSTYINDAESPHINITIIQPNVPAPPQSISDLMATISGDSVLLTWSAVTTDTSGEEISIHHYVIYRGTKAYFNPTPSDSIGYTDSNILRFVDSGIGGVNVVGDVDTNYYYVIKAVDIYGNYSDISNRVGEYDYEIVVTPTTDFSYVTLPFTGTGITDADDLISSIGASKINNVSIFIQPSQSYAARFAAGYGTNFSVVPGGIYQVNAKSYTIWSIAGAIPPAGSISYSIITTPTTDFNFISIPFEDGDIYHTAQDVIDSLPGALNTLNNFIPSSQSWQSRFAAGYGPNFGVKPGGVYQANAKASATFPPAE